MSFSPNRVVALLASLFPPDSSPPSRDEKTVADRMKLILVDVQLGDIFIEEEEDVVVSFLFEL